MKAFYYYMQYLDQFLFVPTALLVVGSVATIHKELGQWLKYVHLLHNSKAPKILATKGMDLLFKEHDIPLKLAEISETKPLQTSYPKHSNADRHKSLKSETQKSLNAETQKSLNADTQKNLNAEVRKAPNNSAHQPKKKSKTSEKPKNTDDEIDAIFDMF